MKTEKESMEQLEKLLGKDNLSRLTAQLVARHGNQLEAKLMSALSHLDKNYDVGAVGELLEDDQFLDVDKISEWADAGEKPQLEFESMRSESDVIPEKDVDYEESGGLDFSGSMQEYDK